MVQLVFLLALASSAYGVVPFDERVAGGTPASATEFTYPVSVRYKGKHICGGALVTKKGVVTAAHCVQKYESEIDNISILAKTVELNGNGGIQTAEEIFIHDQFMGSRDYDIAVINLPEEFAASGPIDLIEDDAEFDGVDATLTGWGRSGVLGELNNKLQKAVLKKVECDEYYPEATPRMICYKGTKGKFGLACHGDSGSPVMVKINGNQRLIGIVPSTSFCQRKGFVDIFVNIQNQDILDFINTNIAVED